MAATGTRAGHLIKAGAVGTCLRTWHRKGRTGACWAAVRRELHELFPAARHNSIEAVIRIAREAAACARWKQRAGPDAVPPPDMIPSTRRLVRAAFRE
jgi:hypothetical protein